MQGINGLGDADDDVADLRAWMQRLEHRASARAGLAPGRNNTASTAASVLATAPVAAPAPTTHHLPPTHAMRKAADMLGLHMGAGGGATGPRDTLGVAVTRRVNGGVAPAAAPPPTVGVVSKVQERRDRRSVQALGGAVPVEEDDGDDMAWLRALQVPESGMVTTAAELFAQAGLMDAPPQHAELPRPVSTEPRGGSHGDARRPTASPLTAGCSDELSHQQQQQQQPQQQRQQHPSQWSPRGHHTAAVGSMLTAWAKVDAEAEAIRLRAKKQSGLERKAQLDRFVSWVVALCMCVRLGFEEHVTITHCVLVRACVCVCVCVCVWTVHTRERVFLLARQAGVRSYPQRAAAEGLVRTCDQSESRFTRCR